MITAQKQGAIRHLLDERNPADAMAAYFAFYYPPEKTTLVTYPADGDRASGYVALSRTGVDLFRPFVTLRLPDDMRAGTLLLQSALPEGASAIISAPAAYFPLLQALFDIETEEHVWLYRLDPRGFEPIINVLVTQDTGANGFPRFLIRPPQERSVTAAVAGLNWMTSDFGEISVNTAPGYRRRGWGRSVVSAMANHLIENGRIPLYVVAKNNEASIQLAEGVGFTYTGIDQVIIQGSRRPLSL